jgi:hypothetical protein
MWKMSMLFRTILVFTCLVASVISAETVTGGNGPRDKIALLFLTRSELNHPDLWRELLQESKDRFKIYIHSKEGMKDLFFKRYCVFPTVPTSWEKHVRAWQVLIREALKDPRNKKFVFLTESCVPLYSLRYIYDVLMRDSSTHMQYSRPWWNRHDRDVVEIAPKYRWGNSEKIVLNRKHAEIVANDEKIIDIISQHWSDAESYFACLLAIHGRLHEVENHLCFYELWDLSGWCGEYPYPFSEVSEYNNNLIDLAYSDSAHLFIRKITKSYPQSALLNMIRTHSKGLHKKARGRK